jgi:chloramphenicol-sensitive protein RarD
MDGPAAQAETDVTFATQVPRPAALARGAHPHAHARAGVFYGVAAYLAWGLVPLYFKLVAHVPSLAVLAHRVVWSVAFLLVVIAVQRRFPELRAAVRSRRLLGTLLVTSLLVAGNWLSFIYAVSTGQVLQASLGYFILPLVAVLLGMVFLHERLRPWQAAALALAAAGVLNLVIRQGVVPWLSLTMAITFAFYGLLRKLAAVAPLVGLTVETTLLLPPALAVVAWQVMRDASGTPGGGSGAGVDVATYPLLMLAGIVTAVPLLWFATAAKRLRLATLGFLQYIAPTCQFLLAVLVYDEPFTRVQAISFACIWTALVLYSVDSMMALRDHSRAAPAMVTTTPLPE